MSSFLKICGYKEGGYIRCNQGSELANCREFGTTMQRDHQYQVEPTGADSPSQNSDIERYNDIMAVLVCALLYGASLSAEYWSDALPHSVYLHNRRVSQATARAPFVGWHRYKPNL